MMSKKRFIHETYLGEIKVKFMKIPKILISCMYQNKNILKESNLFHDVVVVNQCDCIKEHIIKYPEKNVIWINSPERGLSRSRNLAIAHSESEICIIADDDEFFIDNVQETILNVYKKHPEADLIVFQIENHGKKLKNHFHKLSFAELFHVCSVQITFRKDVIKNKNISFDINMGAGTGNGGGEDSKFLFDCYKKEINMYYAPVVIASLKESKSTWFNGFSKEIFYNQGATTRHIFGVPFSILYAFYWTYAHRKLYKQSMSFWNVLQSILKGIYGNKIGKLNNKRKV